MSLPQLTQMHSRIFLTLVANPVNVSIQHLIDCRSVAAFDRSRNHGKNVSIVSQTREFPRPPAIRQPCTSYPLRMEKIYAPGCRTGLASMICPKCPGHSDIPSPQVWHLKLRSMVPILGSIKPPTLTLRVPSSITSGYSIFATLFAFYCAYQKSCVEWKWNDRRDSDERRETNVICGRWSLSQREWLYVAYASCARGRKVTSEEMTHYLFRGENAELNLPHAPDRCS